MKKEDVNIKKKILLLGSGYVSAPFIDYLFKRPEFQITIGNYPFQLILFIMGGLILYISE